MQKAVLATGKAASGNYVPWLVDDGGRLVIEVGAQVATMSGGPQPVVAKLAGVDSSAEQIMPRGMWLRSVIAENQTNMDTTLKIGTTPGGDDIVDDTVIEKQSAEVLVLKQQIPRGVKVFLQSAEPVLVTIEFGSYQLKPTK